MRSPSIHEIGKIVFPELKYKERTIEQIVKRITTEIKSVFQYIQVTHVSDTSVVRESLIEVDSFLSMKKRKSKNKASKQLTTDSHSENSSSQDETTLSLNNPPNLMRPDIYTQVSY